METEYHIAMMPLLRHGKDVGAISFVISCLRCFSFRFVFENIDWLNGIITCACRRGVKYMWTMNSKQRRQLRNISIYAIHLSVYKMIYQILQMELEQNQSEEKAYRTE